MAFILLLSACSDTSESSDTSDTSLSDITDKVFTNRSANCADYANSFTSSVKDVNNSNQVFNGSLTIYVANGECSFATNQIPNHDFYDGGTKFANDVAEVNQPFTVTATPEATGSVTQLSLSYDNAIFLNGSKLDLLAAACYNVGNGKIPVAPPLNPHS